MVVGGGGGWWLTVNLVFCFGPKLLVLDLDQAEQYHDMSFSDLN